MSKKYDFLIVGAGLTGAVFAHEATRKGKRCLVIDRRNHIGGNIYTYELEGINVHKYGAHIFHTSNKKIWDFINQFAEFNNYVNSPIAKIGNETYNLPFNMNTFSKMWNITTPEEAKNIIDSQRKEIKGEPKNLEEQAISMVGRDIYEKLVKGYTEKQWGRPCDQLPPEIIKRLPVRFTYDNNYFNDRYQGIPNGGYTNIISKMLDGSDVELNCNYFDNYHDFKNYADMLVFTGMIDEFFNYKFGKLEYRSLKFETEILNIDDYQGNAVVNYTGHDKPYTRIIEHKHFEFSTKKKTVITKEYPMDWKRGNDAYYPINTARNIDMYNKYAQLASDSKDVIFCGRLGKYKYYNMDDTIASILEITEKLFKNE